MDPDDLQKEYSNGEVTIVWKSALYQHSGNCVKMLPNVFNPYQRPWINTEGANSGQLVEAVKKCPSGALSYYLNTEPGN